MERSETDGKPRRSFDWRSPKVILLLAGIAVAVLAVPAWARMDDGADELQSAAPAPGENGRPGAPPMPGPLEGAPMPPPGGEEGEDFTIPVPPPPGAPEGEGTGARPEFPPDDRAELFPLSDEEMAEHRRELQEFVDCMGENGFDDLGEGPNDEFQKAAQECGGPPRPPVPPPAP